MQVAQVQDTGTFIDRFLESIDQFPLIEGETRVHFLYRGPGEDLAVTGDVIGSRSEASMTRVPNTDLFYYSTEMAPNARTNYHFLRDYEKILDPLNPRETVTEIYGPDMDMWSNPPPMPVSWMAIPVWDAPAHLAAPPPQTVRGRLVTHELESEIFKNGTVTLQVYVPPGYEENERRYPVAYYHDGLGARTFGAVPTSLDNLLGTSVRPLIAVFIEPNGFGPYPEMWADELVPFIDTTYRTIANADGRAHLGAGFSSGMVVLRLALTTPELARKVAVQSFVVLNERFRTTLAGLLSTPAEQPMDFYIEWGLYDGRAPHENWDVRAWTREFAEVVESRGYTVAGGEVPDGIGWSSWKNRTDRVLRSLFPLDEGR